MNNLSEYNPRLVTADHKRGFAYIYAHGFLLRADRWVCENDLMVSAWPHAVAEQPRFREYVASLESIKSVLDVSELRLEGASVALYPRNINVQFAHVEIDGITAPFSIGRMVTLFSMGLRPDRIIPVDGDGRADHALLLARPTAGKHKKGRVLFNNSAAEIVAMLMCGASNCQPSGQMVFE